MLTLKLCKTDEHGRHIDVFVACATIEVTYCDAGGYLITAYTGLTHIEGVQYTLTLREEDKRGYHTCFVLNKSGKTIDKYKAYLVTDNS